MVAHLSDRSIAYYDCLDCLHLEVFCWACRARVRGWNGEYQGPGGLERMLTLEEELVEIWTE